MMYVGTVSLGYVELRKHVGVRTEVLKKMQVAQLNLGNGPMRSLRHKNHHQHENTSAKIPSLIFCTSF